MIKSEAHELRTSRRLVTLTVVEFSHQVAVNVTADRRGVLGDEGEIHPWLTARLARFEDDPRPVTMTYLGTRIVTSNHGDDRYIVED